MLIYVLPANGNQENSKNNTFNFKPLSFHMQGKALAMSSCILRKLALGQCICYIPLQPETDIVMVRVYAYYHIHFRTRARSRTRKQHRNLRVYPLQQQKQKQVNVVHLYAARRRLTLTFQFTSIITSSVSCQDLQVYVPQIFSYILFS